MNILGYKVLHDDETPNVIDLHAAYYRGEIDEDELHCLEIEATIVPSIAIITNGQRGTRMLR